MAHSFPNSPSSLEKFLRERGGMPAKKWGQNFLLDENVHRKIVSEARLEPEDCVLEIGGGLGHLTRFMVGRVRRIWCAEIDPRWCQVLNERFGDMPGFELLCLDVLSGKHSLAPALMAALGDCPTYKIVANLPYNIAAPLIVNFLKLRRPPQSMVLMIQKEVADRLTASPGSSDYGPLTLYGHLYSSLEKVCDVSPSCFYPRPKVYSTVLKLAPCPAKYHLESEESFKKIVDAVFNMRRKTLLNGLGRSISWKIEKEELERILRSAGFSPERRGESLSVEEFVHLSNLLFPHFEAKKKIMNG